MQLSCDKIEELAGIAKQIISIAGNEKIIAFKGDLGAGKTALVQRICNELKVNDSVNSPTYSLVNEYDANGKTIYHFDLYRIENLEELNNIGFSEYIDSNALVLIEWPEIILDYLDSYILVEIKVEALEKRIYNIKKIKA